MSPKNVRHFRVEEFRDGWSGFFLVLPIVKRDDTIEWVPLKTEFEVTIPDLLTNVPSHISGGHVIMIAKLFSAPNQPPPIIAKPII